MRWTTNKEQHAYMKKRRDENLKRVVPAEEWAWEKIRRLQPPLFFRQHIWGVRLFDFFSPKRGVAVEIDGPTHDSGYDSFRDWWCLLRSGILVLRVPNFDEAALAATIATIRGDRDTRKQRARKVHADSRERKDSIMAKGERA